MIPDLSELVTDLLLSVCCYGDEEREGSQGRKSG